MYQLKNWYIEKKNDRYRLWGNVYQDERFEEGQWIHTSLIREMHTERNCLIVKTHSSEYQCAYADHQNVDLRVLKRGLRDFLWPDNDAVYDKIINIQKKQEKVKSDGTVSPADLNTCSVFTFSSSVKNGFISLDVKSNGKIYHTISYDLHKGMYEDFMEVSDPNLGYDYRFFQYKHNGWQFDPWSDKFSPVFMRNTGKSSIVASTPYGEFSVMPGETILLGVEDDRERIINKGKDEPSYEETTVITHAPKYMKY